MVGALGRFGSTSPSYGPLDSGRRFTAGTSGLRHHGTLAGLDRDPADGFRDLAGRAQEKNASFDHLRNLLGPLTSDPAGLAKRLLRRFGSISNLVDAPDEDLRQCALYGETWPESFLASRRLILDGRREHVLRTKFDGSSENLHQFLISRIGALKNETLIGFFCDQAGYVIAKEILAQGSDCNVRTSLRTIFARAFNLDARRIALAHNHPSGSPEPSASDINVTRELAHQAEKLGILIEDHLVVGRRAVVSMRSRGIL